MKHIQKVVAFGYLMIALLIGGIAPKVKVEMQFSQALGSHIFLRPQG